MNAYEYNILIKKAIEDYVKGLEIDEEYLKHKEVVSTAFGITVKDIIDENE